MSLLLNICKYAECGLIFPNLNDLIEHVEIEHLNLDPEYLERLENEKPQMVPMSYVLPFNKSIISTKFGKQAQTQNQNTEKNTETSIEPNCESNSTSSLIKTNNSVKDFNFQFIMRYGSIPTNNDSIEKPFACPIPGCKKRYKNINGLKYHARNGHTKRGRVSKIFECICGKAYKTAQGLRAHVVTVKNCGEFILPSSCLLPQPDETISLLALTNLTNDFEKFYDITKEETEKDSGFPLEIDCDEEGLEFETDSLFLDDQILSSDETTKSEVDFCIKTESMDEDINVGDSNDCIYS